jgi:hypothetical protein
MSLVVNPGAELIGFVMDLYRINLQSHGQTQVRADVAHECAKKQTEFASKSWWAHLDSNQGPTGYEPVALTN